MLGLVIYKGRGEWVLYSLLIALAPLLGLMWLFGNNTPPLWVMAPVFLLPGIICMSLGLQARRRPPRRVVDSETGQERVERPVHSFFFLPIEYWGALYLGLAVWLCTLWPQAGKPEEHTKFPGGPPPAVAQSSPQSPDGIPQRISVDAAVQAARILKQPAPIYPLVAKQARIQGTVRLHAIVGKDGTVLETRLVSGHPMLVSAAQEGVKQWVYQPVLVNGQPVEAVTEIDVDFSLER